jgi:NADH-ubiquinone oxidoreductase chain 2
MSILDLRYISELKGQFIYYPILSLSLAICLFSMAGIPPLLGFFAKQQVLFSSIYSGYYFISAVAVIVSVISASYYLQIIKISHFPSNGDEANNLVSETNRVSISNSHSMIISVLTLSILFFILNPTLLLNSTHLLSLTIFTQ